MERLQDVHVVVETAWKRVLDEYQAGHSFFEAGGDSIDAVRFVNELQEKLGINVPFGLLATANGYAQIADWAAQELGYK